MARVAVFSLTYPPFVGGAEVAIAEIAKRLSAHEFTVITARLRRDLLARETISGVTVVRVGNGSRWDKYRYPWLAVRAAAAEHQRQRFDLIWGMMASWGGLAALRFKERHPNVPYVLTEQSGDSDQFIKRRTWFWRHRYAQIYTRADRVTAISQFLVQRARSFGAKNVELVPNGADVQHFGQSISPQRVAQEREQLGINSGEQVIVSLSRLVEKNGLDILIQAAARLVYTEVKLKIIIVGSGPFLSRLQRLARQVGVAEQVVFKPYQPHPMLPYVLAAADVFVRPSRSEGFGNAFIESMAAGVPVIGTSAGGIVDFLNDGENGLLVPPDNAEQLAGAIQRLLSDAGLRDKLVRNGKITAQRYDWGIIARHLDTVFTQVTSKR